MGKHLGQHFLSSPRTAQRIVQCAAIQKGDVVLEIGPGTGILTDELLKTDTTVIAVEKDANLAAKLRIKFEKNGNFTLIESDIRDVLKPEGLQRVVLKNQKRTTLCNPLESIKVVANIPYYLSGQLFRLLVSDNKTPPRLLVLMVQKEVAERVVTSKKMNLLALSIQPFMTAHIAFRVGRGQFRPPPSVDSAVLVLERRARSLLEEQKISKNRYFALLKTAFSQKRKMALSVLKKGAFKDYPWSSLLGKCEIEKNARAENISLEQWLCLAKNL